MASIIIVRLVVYNSTDFINIKFYHIQKEVTAFTINEK